MERVVGIEPTFPAWKAGVLPIYDTRIFFKPLLTSHYFVNFVTSLLTYDYISSGARFLISLYCSFLMFWIWSERRDSNPQHPPWQGGALPLSHFRKFGADEGSRTPTPKALDPKSSASANFATSAFFGGLPGNRTPDTLIKSQVLYRLS